MTNLEESISQLQSRFTDGENHVTYEKHDIYRKHTSKGIVFEWRGLLVESLSGLIRGLEDPKSLEKLYGFVRFRNDFLEKYRGEEEAKTLRPDDAPRRCLGCANCFLVRGSLDQLIPRDIEEMYKVGALIEPRRAAGWIDSAFPCNAKACPCYKSRRKDMQCPRYAHLRFEHPDYKKPTLACDECKRLLKHDGYVYVGSDLPSAFTTFDDVHEKLLQTAFRAQARIVGSCLSNLMGERQVPVLPEYSCVIADCLFYGEVSAEGFTLLQNIKPDRGTPFTTNSFPTYEKELQTLLLLQGKIEQKGNA